MLQRGETRLIAWLALTIAVGVLAYLVGSHHRSSTVTVIGPGIADMGQTGGTAYVGAHEPLNRQPYGLAYSLSPGLAWTDASGGDHFGGRPTCLPVARAVHVKDIEAVEFATPEGGGSGTVLWLRC